MDARRTAINQSPHGGSFYPFASREAAASLLLDLYLAYPDENDVFTLPLYLAWLYGAGTVPATPPGGAPTPTHAYDLLIVDANDAVVFDSTVATTFRTTDWGDRRRAVEWIAGDKVCRIVYDRGVEDDFDEYVLPDAALDARTWNRLPKQLRAVVVNDQRLTGRVRLQAGYNIRLTRDEPVRVDGARFREVVDLDCAPGLGIGRQPGCNDDIPVLRSINGQTANSAGNLFLDADDCVRVQFITTGDSYGGQSLSESQARAALLIDDDCPPCCPCDYFVRTYKGLRRMHSRWLTATQELESIRDLYHSNRDRWLEQRECRINDALRANVITEGNCTLAFAVSYCNTAFGCVHPVEIRLNATLYEDGAPVSPPDDAFVCAQAYINDSSRAGEEAFAMSGAWPSFGAVFPYLNPQSSGTLRFRLCLKGCTDEMSLSLTVSAHSPAPEEAYGGDNIALPDLGSGGAYGSAYTTRGLVELTRPLFSGTIPGDCGCS